MREKGKLVAVREHERGDSATARTGGDSATTRDGGGARVREGKIDKREGETGKGKQKP